MKSEMVLFNLRYAEPQLQGVRNHSNHAIDVDAEPQQATQVAH